MSFDATTTFTQHVGKISQDEANLDSSFVLEEELPPPARPPKLSMDHGFSELWNELSLPCGNKAEIKELSPAEKKALEKKQRKAEKLEKKKNRASMKLLQNLKVEDLTVLKPEAAVSPVEQNPRKKKKNRTIGGTLMRKRNRGSFASVGSIKGPSVTSGRFTKTGGAKGKRKSFDEFNENQRASWNRNRRVSSFMDTVRNRLSVTFSSRSVEQLKAQSQPPDANGGKVHV